MLNGKNDENGEQISAVMTETIESVVLVGKEIERAVTATMLPVVMND